MRCQNRQNCAMPRTAKPTTPSADATDYSTLDAARLLGLAVRSVQLMVDRGELEAWKTPGGHRRISRTSVEAALARRGQPALAPRDAPSAPPQDHPRVLLIEDSIHYQNLITLLLGQTFPQLELHTASDGIAGLAMYGQLQPALLLVDILLPGIDGASLITSLRSQPAFAGSRLIVVTSLDEAQREPYAFALQGVTVVHKPRIVTDLPPLIRDALEIKT